MLVVRDQSRPKTELLKRAYNGHEHIIARPVPLDAKAALSIETEEERERRESYEEERSAELRAMQLGDIQ